MPAYPSIRASLLGALILAWCSTFSFAGPDSSAASARLQATAEQPDHQHDFDFEFGSWKAELRRLLHPLSGSNTWVEMEGTSVVRKIWDGRANLGELEVRNATAHVQGLTLRLYNPDSREWNIFWGNASDGSLGTPPMVGRFKEGRGEFYDREMFQGKPIRVRFVFSDITPKTFHFEQAFSADDGKTWETNWIATFTRQEP